MDKQRRSRPNSRFGKGSFRDEGFKKSSSHKKRRKSFSSQEGGFETSSKSDRPRFQDSRPRFSKRTEGGPAKFTSERSRSSESQGGDRDQASKSQRSRFEKRSGGGFGSRGPRRNDRGFRGGRSGQRQGKRKFSSEKIDASLFINKAASVVVKEPAYVITHTFADFKFVPQLNTNLQRLKYVTPTPIQDQSIMHIQQGRDVVGLANTGTGKTGAFLLPLINKISSSMNDAVLIIAPTRELALQIDNEFVQFSQGMKMISALCIGGTSIHKQIHRLKRKPQFIIGTPGRIKDLHERKALRLDRCGYIVLDEVDRMMDMGFIDDIREILKHMKTERQSLFYSATMPPKIKKLAEEFLKEPVTVQVSVGKASENVDQDVIKVLDKEKKFDALKEVLKRKEVEKVLIFCETKRETEKVSVELFRAGFKADSIHGDKSQYQRQKALSRFREGGTDILVATDVAARGLDIKGVTHIINYTIPQTYDDYIHRIGRAGRAGKKGFALTFI